MAMLFVQMKRVRSFWKSDDHIGLWLDAYFKRRWSEAALFHHSVQTKKIATEHESIVVQRIGD